MLFMCNCLNKSLVFRLCPGLRTNDEGIFISCRMSSTRVCFVGFPSPCVLGDIFLLTAELFKLLVEPSISRKY